MGNEIATPRAYALAEKTNSNELLIQNNMRQMVDKAIESGLYLIELKQELPYGQFMSFCDEHVRVKKSQISNYMVAARADPDLISEYKSGEDASQGIIGLVNLSKGRAAKKGDDKLPLSGNLEDEPVHDEEPKKTSPTKEDWERELSKPKYNQTDTVNLFDWSHAFMHRVNTIFRDPTLKKMTAKEIADLLYESMTYSDFGEPILASMIREEIDHIKRFASLMQEVASHLTKPTVQGVQNV